MERCILVRYTQVVLDIVQHSLTYIFIHCCYKCRPTAADFNKVMHTSQIGVPLEDGTNVLCRNVVTFLPYHTPDVPKGLNFGTHHHACLTSRNGVT
jgi:hypothetical protein